MKSLLRLAALATTALDLSAPAIAAESNDFHVARQPGLIYIQPIIMEEKKLIEKHAAALGLKDLKMRWSIITSGGVMTEAIISNSIDMAITGVSNMLLAWGKTGTIKMVTGVAGVPFFLLTRNPNVKSIKDFGPDDRIAVPTIRASMQAMMMGIALEQAYGIGQHGRLDSNQVQLGHPDAMNALLNPQHEVNSHYSVPPFQDIAMKSPLVHKVLTSTETLGGPASVTNAWSTQRFVEANPLKIKAFIAAMDEASDMVMNDTKAAAEIYLAVTKEKITVDELVAVIKQPGAIFSSTPQRSMVWAEYMHRIGMIKQKPASWKDYSFPMIHDRNGS
ncbi:MAG: sulfonate transport system substrate-binding protein [Hyphomicrobiales bacterium]|jgi:NitT/TauT family transport system substrate-binding protein|nr:sulfonate transport system substrate-binding protein [Hyphomicrobiales bacterium]